MKTTKIIFAVAIIILLLQYKTFAVTNNIDLNTSYCSNDFETNYIPFNKACNLINPFICEVLPEPNNINVNGSSDISVIFIQDMNSITINTTNIKVYGSHTGYKSCAIFYDEALRKATINPDSDFKTGEKITLTLRSGIQTSGNTAITPFISSFTVRAISGVAQFTILQNPISGSGEVESIISGDVDNDSDPDICVIYDNKFSVLKNNGSAIFPGQTDYPLLNIVGRVSVQNDFDGDGDLDLAFTTLNYGITGPDIYIYKNNGSGIYTFYATHFGMGGGAMSAGDYDSDGDIDLIIADGISSNVGEVRVLRNNGIGDFALSGSGPVSCCPLHGFLYYSYYGNININDYDKDGDMDYILNGGSENFEFNCSCTFFDLIYSPIYGSGGGSSISPVNYSPYFVSDDINGDKNIDIILNPGHLYVNVNGTFSLSSYPGAGGNIRTNDFDGDGDMDIAEMNIDKINIYKNTGAGSFNLFSSTANILKGEYFTSGDFDGDGDVDIITASAIGSNIAILKNGLCTPAVCLITGQTTVMVGSSSNLYFESCYDGFWEISNYDNTEATITSERDNDSVYVSAGNITGHFVLYYLREDNCGYTLYSQHVYVDNPLPIELASFTSSVNGNKVTLNWISSSEENNSGYGVERLTENSGYQNNWIDIGFVQGHGSTSNQFSYNIEDRNLSTGKYKYRLKQTDFNGNFEYHELQNEVIIGIPDKFYLSQNYPNPFNPTTNFEYGISESGSVSLKIYNTTGKEVATLVNETKTAGYYTVNFNGSNLSSGVYYYRIESGKFVQVKKLVLLK